jgi:hypothetical protein
MNTTSPKVVVIKNIYFYLVSFVALMMMAFSTADLINTLLRSYVFTHADQTFYAYPCPMMPSSAMGEKVDCLRDQEMSQKNEQNNRRAERERNIVRDISFIVVGLPLFLFHWHMVRRKGE